MSEIAMTEKPDIQPIETFLRVERDYFRHATPLTGPGLASTAINSRWRDLHLGQQFMIGPASIYVPLRLRIWVKEVQDGNCNVFVRGYTMGRVISTLTESVTW
jgi:hypothetical protein